MGTGAEDNMEKNLFIGTDDENCFTKLVSQAREVVLKWCGVYQAPNAQGNNCKLVLSLRLTDGSEYTSEWRYGTLSQGPPPDVQDFVVAVTQLTEPWYERQKQCAR